MEKKTETKFIISLALLTVLFVGWTYVFNTTTPADTDDPKEGAERIREIKLAIQERLNVDHVFPLDSSQVSDANAGEHRWISFTNDANTDPCLYTEDVNGRPELYWKDEDGNSIWLTEAGYLRGQVLEVNSVDATAILAANNTWIHALNAAGDDDVKMIMVDANDDTVLPAGSELEANTPPTIAQAIAPKSYVDDQITANADPAYSGGQSHTFNGGLIMKMGFVSDGGAATTVTFDTAFPTAIISAVITEQHATSVSTSVLVSKSTTAIVIKMDGGTYTGANWIAIGY